MAVITLLTDFGTRDVYAGVMKGVILSIAPDAMIVDLTHEVGAQDIVEGAYLLATAWQYFPAGAVHVAVVDPGVGTERRGIAVRGGGHVFVAPDNGVLMWALEGIDDAEFYAIDPARVAVDDISATFHGRDVFAAAAARIAGGAALAEIGERIDDPVGLSIRRPRVEGGRIVSEVVHIDGFGNAITSLDRRTLTPGRFAPPNVPSPRRGEGRSRPNSAHIIELDGVTIEGIVGTYADVASGEIAALFGSSGHLEIVQRDGDAARTLGLARGSRVLVRWE